MSKVAFTLKVFGIYLLGLGLGLTLVPNLMLSLFGIAPTSEVWIRVAGVLLFNIGIYYWYAAQYDARAFFMASVFTRTLILVAFATFALLRLVSPVLILFGLVDFLGGMWTLLALRAENKLR